MSPLFLARGAIFFARRQAACREIFKLQQDIKCRISGHSMGYLITAHSAGSVQQNQRSSMCSSSGPRGSLWSAHRVSAASGTESNIQTGTDDPLASAFKSCTSRGSSVCKRAYLKQLEDELVAAIRTYKMEAIENLLLQLRQYDGPFEPRSLKSVMKACSGRLSQVAEQVVEILKKKGVKPDGEMLELLIRSLCTACKPHKAFAVLKEMAEGADGGLTKDYRRSIKASNAILKADVNFNYVPLFDEVLQFMNKHSLEPDKRTQALMLKVVGAYQDRRKVRARWAELCAEFGKAQTPFHLNGAFVVTLANVGAVWEARLALEELRTSWEEEGEGEDEPEYSTMRSERDWMYTKAGSVKRGYDGVLGAAAADGDFGLVKQLLVEEYRHGYEFHDLGEEYNFLLSAAANAGDLNQVSALAQFMERRRIRMWASSCIAWVTALGKQGRVMDALGLLRRLKPRIVSSVQDVFYTLALASLRSGNLKNMRATVQVMKEFRTVGDSMAATFYTASGMEMAMQSANAKRCYHMIIGFREGLRISPSFHAKMWALGQGGYISDVMSAMKWARNKNHLHKWPLLNVLTYNTAMHACCRYSRVEEMIELMEMMREDGCFRDIATDNSLRNEVTYDDADLRSALKIIDALLKSGKSPDLFTFRFLIEVVSHAGNLDDSVELLSIMEREGTTPDMDTLRMIVFYAARHGRLDVMEKMVRRLRAVGFVVDADMCLAIVSAYVKAGRHTHALTAVEMVQSHTLPKGGSVSDPESNIHGLDAHSSHGVPLVLNFERLIELIERGAKGRDRLRGGL